MDQEFLGMLLAARAGDKESRNLLIEKNMGLVWSVVRRFSGRGYEMEDLFQIGMIGLIKAIDYFDISYEVKLSTYAVPMIIGEIKRFLRDDGMIKISRQIKEHAWKIQKVSEAYRQEYGKEISLMELCVSTELRMDEILCALESLSEIESLNKIIFQNDGQPVYLSDKLIETKNDHEHTTNRLFVEELLNTLSPEEQKIIVGRYFMDETQSSLAQQLGVSQVQISRMEKRILKQLRQIIH